MLSTSLQGQPGPGSSRSRQQQAAIGNSYPLVNDMKGNLRPAGVSTGCNFGAGWSCLFFWGCCVVLPAAAAAVAARFGELAWRFLSAQADARLV